MLMSALDCIILRYNNAFDDLNTALDVISRIKTKVISHPCCTPQPLAREKKLRDSGQITSKIKGHIFVSALAQCHNAFSRLYRFKTRSLLAARL